MDGKDRAHGYVSIRDFFVKKQAIWRGSWRLLHIMIVIWHKNQGFGQETQTQDTKKAYNPVTRFYIIITKLLVFYEENIK